MFPGPRANPVRLCVVERVNSTWRLVSGVVGEGGGGGGGGRAGEGVRGVSGRVI